MYRKHIRSDPRSNRKPIAVNPPPTVEATAFAHGNARLPMAYCGRCVRIHCYSTFGRNASRCSRDLWATDVVVIESRLGEGGRR